MGEPDELYTLRNHFWLGNYQRAVAEGSGLTRLPEQLKIERDEFIYRSYVASGQGGIVMAEISDAPTTPVSLRAIKVFARYMTLPGNAIEAKESIVSTMTEWLSDPQSASSTTVQLTAAMIFMYEDNYKEALRCIHLGATMEHLAFLVQIYLKMSRADLANKQLRTMQQADEDHTLTQLASAWTHLAQGGAKLQEAAYIYDELMDKFGSTVTLLNGSAVANMQMGKFEEAEKSLVDALSKGPNDADTLINLVSCYLHMGKAQELVQRHLSQLKTVAPNHPFVNQLLKTESAFDRVAATYATE